MKAVIVGKNGQLARELLGRAPQDWQVTALGRAEMDIRDREAVSRLVDELRPDFLINAAAYNDIDQAESDPESAYTLNGHGVAHLAEAARETGAKLIHISTNLVFDGRNSTPYQLNDRPNPVSIYGASKLEGERLAAAFCGQNALIIRTSWLYGVTGENFVTDILNLMGTGDEVRVVADQIATPTWAGGLADAVYGFTQREINGIQHWSDSGVSSLYDFAVAIQEEAMTVGLLDRAIPVVPICSEEISFPARRLSYGVLDKSESWRLLGMHAPHWRVNLRRMLKQLKKT